MALIEYGLLKKAVVSTKVGEIPLIIKDGINGFIVDSNDAESFYNKLVKLIEDVDLRVNFGKSLYQTIIENHSEEGVIVKYSNLIKEL